MYFIKLFKKNFLCDKIYLLVVSNYKAYNLDASEFTQCLSGFKSIPKNLKKIYIGDAKGILTKRNKKSKLLPDFEEIKQYNK